MKSIICSFSAPSTVNKNAHCWWLLQETMRIRYRKSSFRVFKLRFCATSRRLLVSFPLFFCCECIMLKRKYRMRRWRSMDINGDQQLRSKRNMSEDCKGACVIRVFSSPMVGCDDSSGRLRRLRKHPHRASASNRVRSPPSSTRLLRFP